MPKYWIKVEDAVEGPFEARVLKFVEGFGEHTLVSTDHTDEGWTQAADIQELRNFFQVAGGAGRPSFTFEELNETHVPSPISYKNSAAEPPVLEPPKSREPSHQTEELKPDLSSVETGSEFSIPDFVIPMEPPTGAPEISNQPDDSSKQEIPLPPFATQPEAAPQEPVSPASQPSAQKENPPQPASEPPVHENAHSWSEAMQADELLKQIGEPVLQERPSPKSDPVNELLMPRALDVPPVFESDEGMVSPERFVSPEELNSTEQKLKKIEEETKEGQPQAPDVEPAPAPTSASAPLDESKLKDALSPASNVTSADDLLKKIQEESGPGQEKKSFDPSTIPSTSASAVSKPPAAKGEDLLFAPPNIASESDMLDVLEQIGHGLSSQNTQGVPGPAAPQKKSDAPAKKKIDVAAGQDLKKTETVKEKSPGPKTKLETAKTARSSPQKNPKRLLGLILILMGIVFFILIAGIWFKDYLGLGGSLLEIWSGNQPQARSEPPKQETPLDSKTPAAEEPVPLTSTEVSAAPEPTALKEADVPQTKEPAPKRRTQFKPKSKPAASTPKSPDKPPEPPKKSAPPEPPKKSAPETDAELKSQKFMLPGVPSPDVKSDKVSKEILKEDPKDAQEDAQPTGKIKRKDKSKKEKEKGKTEDSTDWLPWGE